MARKSKNGTFEQSGITIKSRIWMRIVALMFTPMTPHPIKWMSTVKRVIRATPISCGPSINAVWWSEAPIGLVGMRWVDYCPATISYLEPLIVVKFLVAKVRIFLFHILDRNLTKLW